MANELRDKDGNLIGEAPEGHFQDKRPLLKRWFGDHSPASLTVPQPTGLASIGDQQPVKTDKVDLKMKSNPFLERSRAIQRSQQ